MKKELLKKVWHFNTCQTYNNLKFVNVLQENNVCTDSCVEYQLKNAYTDKPMIASGFIAKKDKTLYLIQKSWMKDFPLVISDKVECIIKENGKHIFLLKQKHSINFKPHKYFEFNELIDNISPFETTNQDNYIVFKIIMFSAWKYKSAIACCTPSGFGKDGVNTPLELLLSDYKKIKEFKTIPAFLREITPNGVLIVNEACGNLDKECVKVLEKFIMELGDKSPVFKNTSLASLQHGTKDLYDISHESIVCIYNILSQYKRKDKYFDFQFENNEGVKDRVLQLKFNGKLIEKFKDEDDYYSLANENITKEYYKKIILTLMYFKEEQFEQKWIWDTPVLNIRHETSFKNICKCLDKYSTSQEQYTKYETILKLMIINYQRMLNDLPDITVDEYNKERNGSGPTGSFTNTQSKSPLFSSSQTHFTLNEESNKIDQLEKEMEIILNEECIEKDNPATLLEIINVTKVLDAKTFMKIPNWERDLEKLKKEGIVFENPSGTIRLV